MSQIRERWPPQGLAGFQIDSGTLATRPVAGNADNYYLATDIVTLFRDTGAAWEVVGAQFYARYLWDIFDGIYETSRTYNDDIVYLVPIQIPRTLTVDRLIHFNSTPSTGGRMGAIYADNGDLPDGGALIVASAATASAGTLRKQELTIANTQLTPGLYWLAFLYETITDGFLFYQDIVMDGGTLQTRFYALAYPGPFTNPCPVTGLPDYCPLQGVRVASIP